MSLQQRSNAHIASTLELYHDTVQSFAPLAEQLQSASTHVLAPLKPLQQSSGLEM